tara:strand:- start:7874 stop:8332 length:459 start_codon:yes stop_codon:yes gene_type:complete
MSCILNEANILYTDNNLFRFYKTTGWREVKGYINKGGYRIISLNKKRYYYHRVVYKCCNNDWNIEDSSSLNMIDHIDRNSLNNNINNLRVATNSQNQLNKKNIKGYYWNKRDNLYQVRIQINCINKWIGSYHTEEDARNAYIEARKKYNLIN